MNIVYQRVSVNKEEPKVCPKCGEYYFGEECVGCHSNQYAHYSVDASSRHKILIALVILGLVVLVVVKNY